MSTSPKQAREPTKADKDRAVVIAWAEQMRAEGYCVDVDSADGADLDGLFHATAYQEG